MSVAPIEKLLSPQEVGQLIGLQRSKIHRMLASGEIPCLIVAQGARRRVFRVKPSVLLQWMKQREVRQ
jgi:excisionase family DNA binding protein